MGQQKFNHEALEAKSIAGAFLDACPPLHEPNHLAEVGFVSLLSAPDKCQMHWNAGQNPDASARRDEVTLVVGITFVKYWNYINIHSSPFETDSDAVIADSYLP